MTSPHDTPGVDHSTNLWEELNRPRTVDRRNPAPPPPALAPSPAAEQPTAATEPNGEEPPSAAAQAMAQLDPQHLLLVGAALFVVVAFFAVRGLGGSDIDGLDASATVATSPAQLAAVDDTSVSDEAPTTAPTTAEEIVPPTTAAPTPDTTVAPEAMAMGLPAALLDSPQSQVFRLYRTALGREPDRQGFRFWSDQVRSGVPLEQLANDFLASVEYQEQFGGATGWDDRAEQLLTNAFGAPTSEEQLVEWRARFAGLDGAALLLAISEADETLDATGTLR